MEVSTGVLCGVESLVRWLHPLDGLVLPDQFIGVAEAHGLIDEITAAVLGQALQDARRWNDAGLSLSIAVNVSVDSLADVQFPDRFARAAEDAGVPPGQLVLEITESRLAADVRGPLDVLTRLRLKRAGLSIDDFGTGHSSLAQLRDFPFGELKIDRGFVHGAGNDATLRAIFQSSMQLSRELGMKTVAEGVEDRADWDFLQAQGCDMAQGYFISKPMPGAEVVGWARVWGGWPACVDGLPGLAARWLRSPGTPARLWASPLGTRPGSSRDRRPHWPGRASGFGSQGTNCPPHRCSWRPARSF